MADTFSSWLKARLIQTGAYNNTWGAVLNADALNMLDDAIAGRSDITLTGLTYSLPALGNGTDSDSRAAILRFIGSPAGAVDVTVPGGVTSKLYAIDNQSGQTVTIKYSGSVVTAAIATGVRALVLCDGTNTYLFGGGVTNADTLGGIAAANYARRDIANTFLKTNNYPWITVVEDPTTTVDAALGNHQRLILTGDRNMATPINPVDGQQLVIQVVQDAVGGRTLNWSTAFLFQNGLQPSLSTVANAVDLFLCFYDASTTKWIVAQAGSISAATGASYNITLSANQCDVSLAALLGSVPVASVVNLVIAQGCVLQALSAGSYALDLSNILPVGSTLNLTNLGYILAHGGDGGIGGRLHSSNSNSVVVIDGAGSGSAGGAAMRAPGAGITFNIVNADGHIWGGGGGGGGGGVASTGGGGGKAAQGGAGGGGAGGGQGGYGFGNNSTPGSKGADGSTGVNGTFGAGQAGHIESAGSAGVGGSGGTWGAAGASGGAVSSTNNGIQGAGGAAGKAIELAGGTATFVSGSGSPNVIGAVS